MLAKTIIEKRKWYLLNVYFPDPLLSEKTAWMNYGLFPTPSEAAAYLRGTPDVGGRVWPRDLKKWKNEPGLLLKGYDTSRRMLVTIVRNGDQIEVFVGRKKVRFEMDADGRVVRILLSHSSSKPKKKNLMVAGHPHGGMESSHGRRAR